ncbi:MAG: type II secretion system protein [Planctomycetaceae bacterium]|nr:type II secretion system GspH family protein [Planctomycetaceae bacterium]
MNRRAFTLIELLVVMAILAVLVAILVPVFVGVMESSRRAKCMSNLKAVGKACHEYAADNADNFPALDSTSIWWRAIGYYSNSPTAVDILDGTRPMFMLMYIPSGTGVKALNYANPAAFVCPSVSTAVPDPLTLSTQVGFASYNNVSYSYQHQTQVTANQNRLSRMGESRPICADKNPLTTFKGSTGTIGGTTYYRMEASGKAATANSSNHGAGQNVLYSDSSVKWTTSPLISSDGTDNMWLPTGHGGALAGTEKPASSTDDFLIP